MQCIKALEQNPNLWKRGGCNDLRWMAQRANISEGAFVVRALKRFMPWADISPEYGLAVTYRWVAAIPRSGFEPIDDSLDDNELAEFFAIEPSNPYRQRAMTFTGDCMLVLGEWVQSRNKILERTLKANEKHFYGSD